MLTDLAASSNSLDPRGLLAELALCASGFSLNLDKRVVKDNCFLWRGGNAMVHSGDLYQEDAVVGTLGDGRLGARKSTKVNFRMKDRGARSLY